MAVLLLTAASDLRAQVTIYTWTGGANSGDLTSASNWSTNTVPPASTPLTSNHLVFGNVSMPYVRYFDLYAQQLEISGNNLPYFFDGSYDTTHIGAGGLVYAPAQPVSSTISDNIQLEATQTWNIQSGTLSIVGNLSDSANNYAVTKTGAGTLELQSVYSAWTGGLILSAGRVVVGPYGGGASNSLGIGTLTFNGGILVADDILSLGYSTVELDNNIVSNGLISTENHLELDLYGTVTLAADTTISSKGSFLYFGNGISGSGKSVTISGPGTVVFDPTASDTTNSYSGGTNVTGGALIFADQYAVPGTGSISVAANGYAGYGSATNVQTGFLNKLNRAAVFGTIGFDTDPSLSLPNTFIDPVDLTGMAASAKLGSADRAILSSTAIITPQGTDYRFGGGGGWLQVDSALTGARALVLDSPATRPLTLRVTNSGNNYSGGTSVTNSGLIFGSISSNPSFPSGPGNVTINTGGYVGFEGWGDQSESSMINGSLAKINPASVGMVGFDLPPSYSNWVINSAIDLTSFTGALYLGTSTLQSDGNPGLKLTGTITPAGGASAPYRFAGYKGGWLEVASTLSGSAGVRIGDPASSGTFGDNQKSLYSTVALSGNNSGLTGNVTLYGGQLMVGQSNGVVGADPTSALGSGSLIVVGMSLPADWADEHGNPLPPELDTLHDGLILPNNISLGTTLKIGDSENYFRLTGQITGTGGLYLEDNADLSLANNTNTFSGGVYLSKNSELDIDADHATGIGPLSFGSSTSSYVYLDTAAPVIGGLASQEDIDYTYIYAEMPNTVLTINQSANSQFQGEFRSDDSGDAIRIVKNGTGTLRLDSGGMNFHNGTIEASLPLTPQVSLQINQGTVVIGQNFYIEGTSPVLWVHGGTLAVDNASVYNPLVVDNGGRLAGNGYFYYSPVTIGTGATVAPGRTGVAEIGLLQFAELNLAGGGAYEWNIQNPTQANGGWDTINVFENSTLNLSSILLTDPADSAHRFTLKVISLKPDGTPGLLSGFDPSQSYSWTIFTFNSINAYDPSKILIDTTQFANSLSYNSQGNGAFFLSLGASQVFLNFTPVPEPATYALMLLGLGGVALPLFRRKRG